MSATTLTFRGRLPGVDCSPALPPVEQPVRLDVAAFVGLAERGPVGVPVAIPDHAGFRTIFGGDLVLATEGGTPVYAQLPQAVKAFFDNGGVRCYALRVAGWNPVATRWVMPNVAIWFADGTSGEVAVEAAWPGGWSADLAVTVEPYARPLATGASYRPMVVEGPLRTPGELRLAPGVASTIQVGDLVELDLGASGAFVRVSAVAGSSVGTDLEIGYRPGSLPGERIAEPAGSAGLDATVVVDTVVLHRLDLVVHRLVEGQQQQLERFDDLGFGGLDRVLQPSGSVEPDVSRSLNLRADAATDELLLAGGLLVPVAGRAAAPGRVTARGADDLDVFDREAIFLDDRLRASTVFSLMPDADSLTSLAAEPTQSTPLRGIHALLGVTDVAMLACPDLTQRGWAPAPVPPPDPPETRPPLPAPPDLARFHCCDDEDDVGAGVAGTPDRSTGLSTDAGPAPVGESAAAGRVLDTVASFDAEPLLTVQAAMITMCAARGDVVALLSLPLHLDAAAALDWHARIVRGAALASSTTSALTPLSYASYWHPWLLVPEPSTPQLDPLRALAPDGAVAGMIAARELARGAWIAPAHQALKGPVGLRPVLADGDVVRLFDAHACVITQRPGAFAPLAAHTLADASLLQLSVRRLLILVRKIALGAGQRYVFEVDNDRFRALVRRRFQHVVDQLVAAGALHAGNVVVDDSAAATENGQLIVHLQLAPSSPIEFITVTLVRTGEGLLDVWEG